MSTSFVLVAYICSAINLTCTKPIILGSHDTYFKCGEAGYLYAYKTWQRSDKEKINKNRMVIKLECVGINEKEFEKETKIKNFRGTTKSG